MGGHAPVGFIRAVGAAAIAGSVLVRCGGVSEDSPPQRAPELPPSPQDIRLAEAVCAYLARCDADALQAFAGGSREACTEHFACLAAHGSPQALLPPAELDTCIQSLGTRGCPDPDTAPLDRFSYNGQMPWGPSCGQPGLDELLAAPPDAPTAGQPCITRLDERAECADGSYCSVTNDAPSFGIRYCGTCEPSRAAGETCEESKQCATGHRCVEGTCMLPLGAGEPCTVPEQCRFRACEAGTCAPSEYVPDPFADVVGSSCSDRDYSCGNQLALSCVDGRCTARRDEGEACGNVGCRFDLACVDGSCMAIGCTVDVGEPCGGFCDGACVDGTCRAVSERPSQPTPDRSNGTPCDFDADCDSGYCERDLSDACSGGLCTIPPCDGCGLCAPAPTAADCSSP